jgi:hypothetical protein
VNRIREFGERAHASVAFRRLLGVVEQERHESAERNHRGAKAVIDQRAAARLSAVVGDGEFPEQAVAPEGAVALDGARAVAPAGRATPVTAIAATSLLCLWAGARANHDFGNTVAHAAAAGGSFEAPTAAAGPMFGASRDSGDAGGDPAMTPKNSARVAAMAVAAAVTANGALAGDAVQWRVEDGGNGHWYRVVVVPGAGYPRITWDEARNRAIAAGGYLATVSTIEENAFLFRDVSPTMFNQWSCWIGGLRTGGGGWQWVNGEPFSCDTMPGCPFCCGENRLYTGQYGSGPYLWIDDHNNDFQGGKNEYLIEWSADCNNDGIVDYGQIRDGTFADTNANGVLDCCESAQSCCIGDIYIDGRINGADLGIVLSEWGPVTPTTNSDLDGNGRVDGADLGLLLSHWGPCGG